MKTRLFLISVILTTFAAFTNAVDGPMIPTRPWPGFRLGTLRPRPLYQQGQVRTLKVTVSEVQKVASPRGLHGGVHLLADSPEGKLNIHVGPAWFLDQKGFVFWPADELEITGSRVDRDGEKIMLASKIKKGSRTINLRDDTGRPFWSGGLWR